MDSKDKQTIFKEEDKNELQEKAEKTTSTGLDENLAAALAYPLGVITGLLFLVLEKDNRFVKFHAIQSIFVSLALFILSMVVGAIPVIGWIISIFSTPIIIIFLVILAFKAYKGEWVKVPVVGEIAEKQVS